MLGRSVLFVFFLDLESLSSLNESSSACCREPLDDGRSLKGDRPDLSERKIKKDLAIIPHWNLKHRTINEKLKSVKTNAYKIHFINVQAFSHFNPVD